MILKFIKFLRIINLKNHDYMIFIKIICVNENIIFFILIFKKMNKFFKWAMKNDLNENIMFQCNDTEYTNDDIVFDWMQYFVQHVQLYAKKAWMLFIINKFKFYATCSVLNVIRVAASDRKSDGSPSVWRRRKHFWPKIRSDSGSGSKNFWKTDPL